jgi:hypothetical protein
MTNEQTALLLRSIAVHAHYLAEKVSEMITDGEREHIRVWVGEGPQPEEPALGAFPTMFKPEEEKDPYYQRKNWAYKPEGEYSAVLEIEAFSVWLNDEADKLTEDKAAS